MADIYLSSVDGDNADNGSTWALAKATLVAALTAAGAGGRVFVDHAHAETQAGGMTLASPGTAASPTLVICVDRTGNPEPPTARATTGTVTSTAGNVAHTGVAYVYGLTVSGANIQLPSSGGHSWVYEESVLAVTASGGAMIFGDGSVNVVQAVLLINTDLSFNNTSQEIRPWEVFDWKGGAVVGATVPTTLFDLFGRHMVIVQNVDLSALGSGKNLCDVARASGNILFLDCKLGASVAITTGTFAGPRGAHVEVINSDSADTNYRFHRQNYQATETQETTIVRTGGASDGTTTFSRKVVSTANVTKVFPYEGMWIELWNETVGSAQTATVEIITDNVTLTDAEAWLEVEYLGTSGFPLGLFANDRVADPIFGTPANQATSTVDWTTTGLATPIKQKLGVAFTAQEKGLVRARVVVAKASTTVYYDPLITLS